MVSKGTTSCSRKCSVRNSENRISLKPKLIFQWVNVIPLQVMSVSAAAITASQIRSPKCYTDLTVAFTPYLGVNYHNLYKLTVLESSPSFCNGFHWHFCFPIVHTHKEMYCIIKLPAQMFSVLKKFIFKCWSVFAGCWKWQHHVYMLMQCPSLHG